MITQNDLQQLAGATVHGPDGKKIGSVGQVYLDNSSNDPQWVTVKTGLFGTKESFVPLEHANLSGDRIEVPYTKDQIQDAPRIDEDGDLSPDRESELYRHYDFTSGGDQQTGHSDAAADSHTERSGDAAPDSHTERSGDASGPDGYDGGDRHAGDRSAGDAMTRSEERLVAGTRSEVAGKARLRKHVVTEQQQVTVPVSREEVRLEREPITDVNRDDATAGPDITESDHEVILRAERPVVDTEAVPVERVRLNKETVTDQQNVSGEVRKEQIDYENGEDRRRF
jgi:uncharacterized protein (TIGR02271 family)